ncbi:hypothetical protein Tsubulata_027562 [Turnera subulata]|uniref:RRM domain-containing protein n=1 Tax=Turnera subulata TaxID=218843 RepID=A0A9Q0J4F8_9ROSI|nr:hypothetical protein Tsubulata_027562 [Turnera subulata]
MNNRRRRRSDGFGFRVAAHSGWISFESPSADPFLRNPYLPKALHQWYVVTSPESHSSPFPRVSRGLSRLTTDEKLREAFAPFGQLVDAKVITDRASGRSKGFGFVTYNTVEEAEKAREGMNSNYLDGWVIFVDPAKRREYRPPPQPEPEPSETGFRTNKTVGWCG